MSNRFINRRCSTVTLSRFRGGSMHTSQPNRPVFPIRNNSHSDSATLLAGRHGALPRCCAGMIVLAGAAAAAIGGCGGGDDAPEAASAPTVYYCTETKTVVVAARQQTPAVNPQTGRRTLVPALYCPTCRQWQPAPPPEVLQRNPGAGLCRKHKTPLIADGPLPTAPDG